MKIRICLALAMLFGGLPGCSSTKPWWPGGQKLRVESAPHGAAASLTADEVVQAMRQAGFTDEEIVEKGPELRNTLARSGSARIAKGSTAEAVFAADAQKLYVSSRHSGSFSVPLESSQLALRMDAPSMPSEPAEPASPLRQPERIHYASHQVGAPHQVPRPSVTESLTPPQPSTHHR